MSIIFGNEFMTLINLYWKLRTVTPCFSFSKSYTDTSTILHAKDNDKRKRLLRRVWWWLYVLVNTCDRRPKLTLREKSLIVLIIMFNTQD